jgi:hypothetical protein
MISSPATLCMALTYIGYVTFCRFWLFTLVRNAMKLTQWWQAWLGRWELC